MKFQFIKLKEVHKPNYKLDKSNKEYVKFGEMNCFPQDILELSTTPIHAAILDKKVKMDLGNGIYFENKKFEEFSKSVNKNGETFDNILLKCATDLELFGGYYLQVIWAKDKKNIAEIYHMPFQFIRSGKKNEEGKVTEYFYSEKWSRFTDKKYITPIPVFSTEENQDQPQIYATFKYAAQSEYYPIPSYAGALLDISTLQQISIYHNSAIINNFAPGFTIFFPGPEPTEDEQDEIVRMIEEKYKGAENAGQPMIFFMKRDSQNMPVFEQMEVTNLGEQYKNLSDSVKENITCAHEMPRGLAGLEQPGSLGNSRNLIESQLVFFNDYTKYQQQFLENSFEKLFSMWNLDIEFVNSSPSLMLFSESLMEKVLTTDEIRELFGFEPINNSTTTPPITE